jgi:hypothetical protein
MTSCEYADSPDVELEFYGELEPAQSARLHGHLAHCDACRRRLDDLRTIRDALAGVRAVEGPPGGDWSGFMRRLDSAAAGGVRARLARLPTAGWGAIAASLAIVAVGLLFAARFREATLAPQTHVIADSRGAAGETDAAPGRPVTEPARSLVAQSEEHFERSKLVVLGLATLNPRHTPAAEWAHERELAGSLLPDTRLYRLAAEDRGMTDLARVMGDLETVLLETSMSDDSDPEALDRVQRLIARRDLLVKMHMMDSTGS